MNPKESKQRPEDASQEKIKGDVINLCMKVEFGSSVRVHESFTKSGATCVLARGIQ